MRSGCGASGFSATGFEPVGGGESDSFAGQHGGQASQYVFEVVTRINPETAAVLNQGVEDGGFLDGILAADEEPVLGSEFGGTALPSADGFAQVWAGMSFAETFLDRVEVGELAEDPGDEARGLVLDFKKFPPNMGAAVHEGDGDRDLLGRGDGEFRATGLISFDKGRSLFGGVADPTTAVDLQDGVMGSSHHQRCNDCDAALRRESSDGGVDYVYFSNLFGLFKGNSPMRIILKRTIITPDFTDF